MGPTDPTLTHTRNSAASGARKRVVILGGGFGGLTVAQKLSRALRPEDRTDIILISNRNHFLYTPMLTEVVAGSLPPEAILTPLREALPNVQVMMARVCEVDLTSREVALATLADEPLPPLHFDQLVVALGSTTNLSMVPGADAYAITLKDITDAIHIRNQVIGQFEAAAVETDPDQRRERLTFVVAGGGFSGVEVAGALNDLTRDLIKLYPGIPPEEVRVVVVEGQQRLLGELPEALATYSLEALRHQGIEVSLGKFMTQVAEDYVMLQGDIRIPARTVVWTTGVAMDPLFARLLCVKDRRNRIEVDPYLEVLDHPGVWVLGDCALVPVPCRGDEPVAGGEHQPKSYAPPTAQFAVREAATCAENLLVSLRGHRDRRRVFNYQARGEMAVLGDGVGVGQVMGRPLRGRIAWLMWRMFYLSKLPSWRNRVEVMTAWLLETFFLKDSSLVTLLPEPVAMRRAQRALEARLPALVEDRVAHELPEAVADALKLALQKPLTELVPGRR